jgi:hypothetical protein
VPASAKASFLLTNEMPSCYVGKISPIPARNSQIMTDQSQTATRFRAPLRTQDLGSGQRSLVELMRVHQFGRVENMSIRAGQPEIDQNLKIVRVVCLGGQNEPLKLTNAQEFELKRQVRDLFDELARLENGTVIRLEFRHGLPFLLETTPI